MHLPPGPTLNSANSNTSNSLSGAVISSFHVFHTHTHTAEIDHRKSCFSSVIVKCICGPKRCKSTEHYKIMKTEWILLTDGRNQLSVVTNGSHFETEQLRKKHHPAKWSEMCHPVIRKWHTDTMEPEPTPLRQGDKTNYGDGGMRLTGGAAVQKLARTDRCMRIAREHTVAAGRDH